MIKVLSNIQSKAEECGRQPQQPRLKCNFNICATKISTATAVSSSCKGIHLNHPRDTDVFKQSRGQSTSFLVVDDKQAGPSRPFTFTLTLMKHFNPPSVASATGEESQHKISGLPSFFRNHQPTRQHQPPLLQPPPFHSKTADSLHLLCSQPTPNSSRSKTPAKPPIGPFL